MKFKNQTKRMSTETLALGAILTALVVVLQFIAAALVRLGLFSVSLVLIPIVIGAATCGAGMGAWLGFIFGVTVLLSGDAAAFLTVDVLGTVLVVLLKGTLAGLVAGLVYKLLEKLNRVVAVIASAVVCPLVNTGIFLLGGWIFFLDTLTEWGKSFGYDNVVAYMFFGLVGFNFLFELGLNVVLGPVIVRLLNYKKRK
ncbi:MAG: ECF transporter S component [Clostridia bacterium]|nr:ECF transporter S component [Clostridia bacterium]